MSEVFNKVDQHFSQYPKRSYPKGHILLFGGENPENVFYITKGRVRKYDISYRGDEVIVNIFKPPAFFPMSWVVNRTDNTYFYKTEVATEVHIIPVDDALEYLKANPDVMLDLISRLYKGMDGLLGRVVHLMSGTAKSRLIYELAIECRRFGKQLGEDKYEISLNESDLAARSGLSRETVSREMSKLKSEGLAHVDNRQIIVKDLELLERQYGVET